MSKEKIYPVSALVSSLAHINKEKYLSMYAASVKDPKQFWAEQANELISWDKTWDNVLDWDYRKGHIRWFEVN